MGKDFQLVTLGRLALLASDGSDPARLASQRRKLAVLAVLALSRAPVSRDVLLEMFWGDQNQTRARHSLSDALSHLRRALGPAAITARRADVALAADAPLRVDAIQLADAVRHGDDERALELYCGPFLDAVYVGGSPRFEQWVQRESVRIERLFHTACERRCAALAARGDWEESERVARRWLQSDPLSAGAAVSLLQAIRADGAAADVRRALDAHRSMRHTLASEYELAPDPSVADVVARLEAELDERADAGSVVVAAEAGGAERGVVTDARHATAAARGADVATRGANVDAASSESQFVARGRPKRASSRMLAGVLAAALLAIVLVPLLRRSLAAPPSPATVAIFPFTVHGSAQFGYLREGLVDLLSTNLDGAAGLRTVDPRAVLAALESPGAATSPAEGREVASGLGAGAFVMGEIAEAGGRLRITAALYDAERATEPVRRAYAEGAADSLFSVVDRLTVALIEDRVRRLGGRVAQIAALTTSSIPALKAYLEGERHWRAMRLADAVESFREATTHDTAFALAWYRLGMASSWDADVDVAEDALDRAQRHSRLLSERDRMLIAAYPVHRNPDRAERLYRAVVADYPADVEAWAGLAEMQFHANPWNGRTFQASRQAWEHVLRLEPRNVGAAWHLAYVSARQSRRAELDTLTRRIRSTVDGGADLSIRAIRAAALGSAADRDAVIRDLAAADDFSVILAVWRVAVCTEDLDAVLSFTDLLIQSRRPREVRALGYGLRAHLYVARGQLRLAQRELAALARLDPAQALEYRGLFAALPLHPATHEETLALRDQLRAWPAANAARIPGPADLWVNVHADMHPQLRIYLLGLLSARLGDAANAERSAAQLEQVQGDTDAARLARSLAAEIRTELLRVEGRPRDALQLIEESREMIDYGSARTSPFYARSRLRFIRAELLHEVGRDSEAFGWYSGMAEIYPYDVIHLAPAYLRRAAIHARGGNQAAAAACYQRFIALWRESDPELAPIVQEARRALARLPHVRTADTCSAERGRSGPAAAGGP